MSVWSQSSVRVWNGVTECLPLFPLRNWIDWRGRPIIYCRSRESLLIDRLLIDCLVVFRVWNQYQCGCGSGCQWNLKVVSYYSISSTNFGPVSCPVIGPNVCMVSVLNKGVEWCHRMLIIIPSQKLNDWRGRLIVYCRSKGNNRNNHQTHRIRL